MADKEDLAILKPQETRSLDSKVMVGPQDSEDCVAKTIMEGNEVRQILVYCRCGEVINIQCEYEDQA